MLLNVFLQVAEGSLELWLFCAVVVSVTWTASNALSLRQIRPKNVMIVCEYLTWGKWATTLKFITHGSDTISKSYQKIKHAPFAVPAVKEYMILISRPEQILEVARCPEAILSFHAAMKDRLRHKITMMGFEHNHIDPDEYVTLQVVKVHLRTNMDVFNPVINKAVAESFGREFLKAKSNGGVVSIFSVAKAVVGNVNNQIFFGDELSRNNTFAKAALQYPWHGATTAELCRYVPEFLAPVFGRFMMYCLGSMRTVDKHLSQLVHRRLKERLSSIGTKHVDITQFVLDTSRTPGQRDPVRIKQLIAALLFAVSLAVPMAAHWAILNLCIHRDFVHFLREEIHKIEERGDADPRKSLRLLDCFLRESARLCPPDAVTMQRKVVKEFHFSDGTVVPAGNLIAIPQHAIMRDPAYYGEPDRFDPYRFYTAEERESSEAIHKLTDVNMQYPYWGAPTKPCPGRWYASDVLKAILVHLLKNYDFDLVGPANCSPLTMTTALAPRAEVKMTLRRRDE